MLPMINYDLIYPPPWSQDIVQSKQF